ncbi:MAG: hypothetical protein DWQ07_17460 [Chloroflexi bacterium]|nr:MAG: hypothetical protein DWQ07_17460 [Chloroflexota bacterium]
MIQGQLYEIEKIVQPEHAALRRQFNDKVHSLRKAAWREAGLGCATKEEQQKRYEALVQDIPEVKLQEQVRVEIERRRQDQVAALRRQIGVVPSNELRSKITNSDLGSLEKLLINELELHQLFMRRAAAHARQITRELRNGESTYQDEVPFGASSFKQQGNKITAHDDQRAPLIRWAVDASGVAYIVKRWN